MSRAVAGLVQTVLMLALLSVPVLEAQAAPPATTAGPAPGC